MAYSDVALLENDLDFQGRVTAAYATETASDASLIDPFQWMRAHIWQMAAQPGFGDAYASALANNVERPGYDPSVIGDPQILSAVQYIEGLEAAAGNGPT